MPRTALALALLPAATSTGLRLDDIADASDVANGNVYDSSVPYLYAKNGHATDPKTVTFTATKAGETLEKVVSLVAGEEKLFKLDRDLWGDHGAVDGGKIYVDGESADVKLQPFRRS